MDLWTDPLPRNANGKIIKRQLRESLATASSAAAS
jgi:acyl-coenzyme A synthetase/AMP-(fatty) acid ligase